MGVPSPDIRRVEYFAQTGHLNFVATFGAGARDRYAISKMIAVLPEFIANLAPSGEMGQFHLCGLSKSVLTHRR